MDGKFQISHGSKEKIEYMSDDEIEKLRIAWKEGWKIFWIPDNETARELISIGKRAEEASDVECAIFYGGKYAALYNARYFDFYIVAHLL